MSETRVGFVGLGRMGTLMAANLAAGGFDLAVYNRTREKAEAFAKAHGVRVTGSLAELASTTDVIVTMLADGEALASVLDQAEPGIRAGSVAIDMGTSGTKAVAAVRRRLESKGALLVDAPVSGSTPAAEAASLLIMVGATPESFAAVSPLLEAMGRPELVGPPGAGAALKLTVNSILYALNQAFAEGVALAEASGVTPATTQDVVARSAAGAPLISYRKPQYLDPEHSPVTFTLNLSAKDLDLTLAAAAAAGVPMPQLERTMETVQGLIAAGHGDRDMGFVVEAARRASS
ncbi:MAG TPA: NAD(P)-dependent oxidoreductase [Acidimicrobiia bacterium]|nr:NAD(P)-dependent oxidoreductase [Acidimicrobiia bacterium]